MAHKIAKLMLEQADSFLERAEAVKTALSLGMPLREIEDYLDWLEGSVSQRKEIAEDGSNNLRAKRPMAG